MRFVPGKKMLITCDTWFLAPDGVQYRAVFGTVKGVLTAEDCLGVKTNARSTNWYVEIGSMCVAGCQIHFAIECDSVNSNAAPDYIASATDGLTVFDRPSQIYVTN